MRTNLQSLSHVSHAPKINWKVDGKMRKWHEQTDEPVTEKPGKVHVLSGLYDLCDRAVLRLIQEQRLEYMVVEGWVVEAGPSAVWAKVHFQDLRLHDPMTWSRITTHTNQRKLMMIRVITQNRSKCWNGCQCELKAKQWMFLHPTYVLSIVQILTIFSCTPLEHEVYCIYRPGGWVRTNTIRSWSRWGCLEKLLERLKQLCLYEEGNGREEEE